MAGVWGGGGGGQSHAAAEHALQPAPSDSVQCLSWSPTQDLIVSGGWDATLRMWEVVERHGIIQSQPKLEQKHKAPVFDVTWAPDGSRCFSASADKELQMWDLASNKMQQVGAHDAPIKACRWCPTLNCVVTGSWDKTIKFWDCRQSQPVKSFTLPERVYSLDVVQNLCVVATADPKYVFAYRLNDGPQEYRQIQSQLKMQNRVIRCFPSADGFALGSIEGRVAIQYVQPEMGGEESKKNFSFKCHREPVQTGSSNQTADKVYSINDIAFHPVYGTFATCGSDGKFVFWDKDARNRLKGFANLPSHLPITSCAFNRSGNMFAYAYSYDWSKGHQFYNPQDPKQQNAIMIHPVKQAEVQNKPKK